MAAAGCDYAARNLSIQMGPDLHDPADVIEDHGSRSGPVPRREFVRGVSLSTVGFGGLMLVGLGRPQAERLVSASIDRGVNYFDVSPSYGGGVAEQMLGQALRSCRQRIFLSCKTLERSADGARRELEDSLRRLRTDTIDLYQFHAVNRKLDVEKIFGIGGAMETFLRAREQGLVRCLGFSSHSVPIALALLDRFPFDSILFPVNYVCYARGNFGPQVLERARALGVARVGLKALALTPWPNTGTRTYGNCWYRPIDDPELALQAMRFSLSEDVISIFPPADERLYLMVLALAPLVTPLTAEEKRRLFDSASGLKPIMTSKRR